MKWKEKKKYFMQLKLEEKKSLVGECAQKKCEKIIKNLFYKIWKISKEILIFLG